MLKEMCVLILVTLTTLQFSFLASQFVMNYPEEIVRV